MVNCHFIYHFTSHKYKDLLSKRAAASNLSRKRPNSQTRKANEMNSFLHRNSSAPFIS